MEVRGRAVAFALLVALTVAGFASSAFAAPGDLDSSTGDCGVKTAPVNGYGYDPLLGTQQLPVLQQSDGKVLQLAKVRNGISIARLRSGGSVDPSYGSGGVVTTTVSRTARFGGAAIGPDDKVLVAMEANFKVRVLRYTTAGALDPTFGTDGVVLLDEMRAGEMVVQSDNKPLLLVGAGNGAGPAFDAVVRLLPNGAPDSSYSFAFDPGQPATSFSLGPIALQADNRLLIGGTGFGFRYRIGRWNTDGSRDPAFLIEAPATNIGPDLDTIAAVPGGRILVGQTIRLTNPKRADIGLARFLSDGSPDLSFGVNGSVTHSIGRGDVLRAMRRAGNGDIFVLGETALNETDAALTLVRFDANGTPDARFGRSGHVATFLDSPLAPNGFALFGTSVLVVTTQRLAVPAGTFPDGKTITVRYRTDASAAGRGLVLDGSGKLWPVGRGGSPAPCVFDGPRFTSDLARGVATTPGQGGYVVDAFGGLHPFSLGVRPAPAAAHGGPYWPGWDIVRGVATRPNGKGGYVLDGFGGLHGFGTGTASLPARTRVSASWPGVDLARGVALLPSGDGGYVVDARGGLHPFAIGTNAMPPVAHRSFYMPGGDAARGVALLANGTGGYVVDAFGGLHPFSIGTNPMPPPRPGATVGTPNARGLALVSPVPALPASTTGPVSASPEPLVRWRPSP